ncbi:MAG: acylneuraminate cytidylyltransferase family protein [Rhizobiaceae bacterium]|nr:acylneuraminate cytidylyltransferase family protein [Rhizobiaceae bacterium]
MSGQAPSAIAIVPARGGSKGLPGKNLRELNGHPLIAWSIAAGRASGLFDAVIVSTDSADIAAVSKAYGAITCKRPEALSGDTALVKDAVSHCLHAVKHRYGRPDLTVLLQPTSPLRSPEDITACVSALVESNADSAATFKPADEPIERAYRIVEGVPSPAVESQGHWLPRQQLPNYYYLNGAVYVVTTGPFLASSLASFLFGKTTSVVMPAQRSVDIDTLFDFKLAEMLMTETDHIDPGAYAIVGSQADPFDYQ